MTVLGLSAVGEVPRLSPSTAKILLRRSPLHAWTAHRLGGGERDEPTDAMRRGNVLDRMLLGVGPELVVVEAKDWRTKAAQEARDAAELAGKLPVLVGKLGDYNDVVDAWRSQLADRGITLVGKSQVKLDWTSDGVPCRGILDHLILDEDSATIYDVKTCDDASDAAITRSIVTYGYDIQHAAYVEAVSELNPDIAGRVRMKFIFCETERVNAYAINIKPLGGTMRELGERKWKRAKRMWGECLRTGRYPGYESDQPIEATPFQLSEEMEREMPESDNATTPF